MRAAFLLLSRLPLWLLHLFGGLAGQLVYWLSPTYRHHLRENLRQAGIADGRRGAAVSAAGKMVLELPKIWLNPLDRVVEAVVEVRGWERVETALAAGHGIVFLTPHLGCFEITAQYISTRTPITVLYRPPRHAAVQAMIEEGRARPKLKLAPADLSGVRALIKALRKGEAVGLLPDQAPRVGEGKWLPFFGRPAYTMTLAGRLTETGAAVILVFGERLEGGKGYRLHFRGPSKPVEGDLEARVRAITHEIESMVRECPEQYLWGYNRYKQPAGAEPPPA